MGAGPTKRDAEARFRDLVAEKGWTATRRGWPTFFVTNGDDVILVVIKSSSSRKLRRDAFAVLTALAGYGVPCFAWSPDGGFERFGGGGYKGEEDSRSDPKGKRTKKEQGRKVVVGESEGKEVGEIWAHYVAEMNPRQRLISDEERRIIREALKVATISECKRAITGNARSPFHQGQNERGRKYNTISQILRGKRGRQTTRERIDYFLDLYEMRGVSGLLDGVPSGSHAIFQQRMLDVRRGDRLGTAQAIQQAQESEAWLRQHGIEVRREGTAPPSFHRAI